MQLDVLHGHVLQAGDTHEGAELVGAVGDNVVVRDLNATAAETESVGQAWVSAQRHAVFLGQPD
jgi:hypothetical protein